MSARRASGHSLRRAVIAAACAMNAAGINRGKSGNVSVRTGADGAFLVTPTGLPYEAMQPADIVTVRPDGSCRGRRLPSSEWRFHRDLYARRADVGAIVHAHSPFATTLACLRRGIPAFHYMVATAGGHDIRCAPYATFGTQRLSDRVVAALEQRRACLLAHHGMVAVGPDLEHALALAVDVELLAQMYWQACAIGKPRTLSATEMDAVLVRFRSYGQPLLRARHTRAGTAGEPRRAPSAKQKNQ